MNSTLSSFLTKAVIVSYVFNSMKILELPNAMSKKMSLKVWSKSSICMYIYDFNRIQTCHMNICLILLGIKSSLDLLILSSIGACHRGIGGSTRRCHRLWWSRSPSGNTPMRSPPSRSLVAPQISIYIYIHLVICSHLVIHQIHPKSIKPFGRRSR